MSNTEFGFKFGCIDVTRTASDQKTGVKIISIKTPKARFSVRATRTGHVSFYDEQGTELKLVFKEGK